MSRYHHYFVVVGTKRDDGSILLWVDDDTCQARFDERPIWDSEADDVPFSDSPWISAHGDADADKEIGDALRARLGDG